jgi:hypothetical protein
MDIGASLTAAGSCYFYYSRPSNQIFLADDTGAFGSSLTLGVPGTMQNSQCTLDAGASSAKASASDLAVTLVLSFKPAFAGKKGVYFEAQNATADSGWVLGTTFTVTNPAPTPNFSVSVVPSSQTVAAGGSAQFNVTVTPINGFSGVVTLGVSGLPAGESASFNPPSVSISGSSTMTIVTTAGASGSIFTVTGTSGSLENGTSVTLNISSAPQPPSTVSVTPSSGSGASQVFAFAFSDPAGATDIVSTQMDINSSLSAASACYIYYSRASNQIQLANDGGSFGAALTVGTAGTMQNSQCTVDAGASSVVLSANTLTLNLALSFKPAFAGAKNIYMEAQNATFDSGWSPIGTFTTTSGGGGTPQAPSTVSVTPSSGSGASQTFAFVFSDPAGAIDIASTQMDINSSLTAAGGCYLYYSRASNQIQLANDGGSFGTALTVGTAGTLTNSQCTLDAGASSVTPSGNTLTLNVALSFKAAFAGAKNIYMEAQNATLDSGWSPKGTFTTTSGGGGGGGGTPQAPSTVSVTPSSGSGASQTFAFAFSDSNGATDIQSAQMDINASLSAAGACYLYYSRASNQIQLANDGGSFGTALTVGTPGTLQNSQCTLDAGASSVTPSGNTLTLNLALSFKPAFAGAKNIYMEAQNATLDSGWSLKGSFTTTSGGGSGGGGTPQPPAAVSVTPSSGSGASQTFAFVFSDAIGATDIQSVQLDISAALTAAGACYLYYSRGSNQIQLANDSGSFGAPLTVGTAGTMQNSQCTLDAGASSVMLSGNTLTLNVALSFKPAFAGAKNIYMEAQNATLDSGWSKQGTFNAQ